MNVILVYSRTLEEHKQHLRTILEALRTNELCAKLMKCEFWFRQGAFLRCMVPKGWV